MTLNMKDMISIIILLIILGVLIITYLKHRPPEGIWPYGSRKVLTDAEQILFHRLVSALPDYLVLTQVRLSRVLEVKKGKGIRVNEWNHRINGLGLDFVICSKDFSVLAVIELGDKTHIRKKHIDDDKRKNKALADAGVRLIRWDVESIPNEIAMKEELRVETGISI